MATDAEPAEDDGSLAGIAWLRTVLRSLAETGRGTVLGLEPAGRSGIKRVSRPPTDLGDRFAESFRAQRPALLRRALSRLGNQARAEDVVQRAFARVWQAYQRDPARIQNLDAYIHTAVANEINREIGEVVAERNRDDLDTAEQMPDPVPDLQIRITEAMEIAAALRRLPSREREAVVLRTQYQLSVRETADVMHLSPGAVKRYTSDALRRLREHLAA